MPLESSAADRSAEHRAEEPHSAEFFRVAPELAPNSSIKTPTRRRWLKLLFFANLVLGGSALAVLITRRQGLPKVTPEALEQAREKWAQRGLSSYRVRVHVSGRQPAVYEVVVREGEVESARRNDLPLKTSRTLGTWSVPGMFATIQLDLDAIRRHQPVMIRAAFDEQYGYPRRFHRLDTSGTTGNPEVYWEVKELTPITDDERLP